MNRLNTQESSDFRRDFTRDDLVRKRGAESDLECSDVHKSRRLHLGSIASEILNRKEPKCGTQFDEKRKAKRLCARFAARVSKVTRRSISSTQIPNFSSSVQYLVIYVVVEEKDVHF